MRSMSRPVKRSFTIAGHRTSISLEAALLGCAQGRGRERERARRRLISRIDAERGSSGLSSAVRVWLLAHYRAGARRPGG